MILRPVMQVADIRVRAGSLGCRNVGGATFSKEADVKRKVRRLQKDSHLKPWIRPGGKAPIRSSQSIWDFLRGIEEHENKRANISQSPSDFRAER